MCSLTATGAASESEPLSKVKGRKQNLWIGGIMKLSVEAKVAASVAAGFVALTVGVIEQGNSAEQSVGPNGYGPINNAGVSTQMSQHGYDSSLARRTNSGENRQGTQWQHPE
jgi:hypothetical protein